MCLCLWAGDLGYPARLSTDKEGSIPHPGSLLQINAQIKPFPRRLLPSLAPRLILIIKTAVANYFRGFGQCVYVCVICVCVCVWMLGERIGHQYYSWIIHN